jgi:hypothetical protein
VIFFSDLDLANILFFFIFFKAFSAAMDYFRYSITITFLAAWNCLCAVKPCMAISKRFDAGFSLFLRRWLWLRERG